MSIRVLVVDDSALMRALLTQKLEAEADITVVGTAADASEARQLIKSLNPDVVTLDIEMPGMDGLSFLEKIMTLRPTPVIIVSGATCEGAAATARALQLGAVNCYAKSTAERSLRDDDGGELARLVREASKVRVATGAIGKSNGARPLGSTQHIAASIPAQSSSTSMMPEVIAIGASTGGVEALHTLLKNFPAHCPPTLVVQHVNACFSAAIAQALDKVAKPTVRLAHHDLRLTRGMVVLAPDNEQHLQIARDGANGLRCVLEADAPMSGHRPSVDRLFHSAAKNAGINGLGILLTGMGQDGAEGLLAMAKAGARTIAQDEASCVVFGMPRAAIALGAARQVCPLGDIANSVFSTQGAPA
ncbi:MAG: chemotaxis response regulator protein-glutamate methylesterase [Pseudomonadota bacterium]